MRKLTEIVRSHRGENMFIDQSWMDAFTAARIIMGNHVPSHRIEFTNADMAEEIVCSAVRTIMDNPVRSPKIDIISIDMKTMNTAEWEQQFVAYFQDGLSIPLDQNRIPNPATWTRLSRAKKNVKDWRQYVVDGVTIRNFSLSTLSYYDVKRENHSGFTTFNSTI